MIAGTRQSMDSSLDPPRLCVSAGYFCFFWSSCYNAGVEGLAGALRPLQGARHCIIPENLAHFKSFESHSMPERLFDLNDDESIFFKEWTALRCRPSYAEIIGRERSRIPTIPTTCSAAIRQQAYCQRESEDTQEDCPACQFAPPGGTRTRAQPESHQPCESRHHNIGQ